MVGTKTDMTVNLTTIIAGQTLSDTFRAKFSVREKFEFTQISVNVSSTSFTK